jgi:hypothetical protein
MVLVVFANAVDTIVHSSHTDRRDSGFLRLLHRLVHHGDVASADHGGDVPHHHHVVVDSVG